MQTIKLKTPLEEGCLEKLRAGDKVLLSGKIYVARDQAHIRLIKMIDEGKEIPIDLKGQVIYYAGPSPAKPGEIIGSVGPTTSIRMDKIAEPLLKKGLKITIGKGERSAEFKEMVKRYKAPYLAAMGGSGAVMQKSVIANKLIAFEDLGGEAVYELTVKDMPLYTAYDTQGGEIYSKA